MRSQPSFFSRLIWRHILAGFCLGAAATGWAADQNPEPVPTAPAPASLVLGVMNDESVLLTRLTGVAFYSTPEAAQLGEPGTGLTLAELPLMNTPDLHTIAGLFLDQPVSREGLDRLAGATRSYLSAIGYPFSLVYLPPQDITTGIVRYVVTVSRLETKAQVKGARYFSPDLYQAGFWSQPGQPFSKSQLDADLAWINRNPFRAVRATVVAGQEPGTSQILLQVNEKLPWQFFTGADNTGTKTTQEERFNAGFNWGNAFGLGHQLTAQWNSSWDFETLRSVSGSYAIDLPWRHTLSLSGSYSRTNGLVAAPFALKGTSWQVSGNYDIALASTWVGFTHSLQFGVDFKSSDNNFTFATIPINDNLTHVAQARATWSGRLATAQGVSTFGATLTAAPGGLTDRNKDVYFNLSRSGAKADYLYLRGNASHTIPLEKIKHGLSWSIRGQAQFANHNLIGSEQFGAGGSSTVRGYEEGEVYKDNGVLLSQELRLPPWTLHPGHSLQGYIFEDYAHVWSTDRLPGESAVNLHSVGVGFDLFLGSHASVRAAYGWQLSDSGNSTSGDNARLHLSANLSF